MIAKIVHKHSITQLQCRLAEIEELLREFVHHSSQKGSAASTSTATAELAERPREPQGGSDRPAKADLLSVT